MIKHLKFMKIFKVCACILVVFLVALNSAHAALKYQKLGAAKPNSKKGYDFYDDSNKKTGFSLPNRHGGFDFYDERGNRIGSLRQDGKKKNSYKFYDADGILKGTLKKSPSGIYYYKDTQSGKLVDSIPQVSGKLGSLSPWVFRDKNPRNR